MNWFRNLKSNRSATTTFIVLFVGFVLIQVAGSYMANLYTVRSRHPISRRQLGQELVRKVKLLDIAPVSFLQKHIRWLQGNALVKLQLIKAPKKNVPIIESSKPKALRAFVNKHFYRFRANYQLPHGQWVYMQAIPVQRENTLLIGFVVVETFLLILLLLLCIWVVQRLAIPVQLFELAAKRFGVDVQAPPLAKQGTPEMQAVIDAFNEMQGRIRRLIMDRTQMLAAISHDLRTPITRLQLRIEALKGSGQYEKAEADLKEMERMIASILSFARDYVRTEQMERFDLNALVDNICNELQDTGLAVAYGSTLKRLAFFGRLSAIKRALTNLIENAVKYGKRADVSMQLNDEMVKLKIQDQGPGIPADEMEKVFAPFYRVDPARNPEQSGTGLGMATARDIIRAHGGDISLHNCDGGGLLVIVTLPSQPVSE